MFITQNGHCTEKVVKSIVTHWYEGNGYDWNEWLFGPISEYGDTEGGMVIIFEDGWCLQMTMHEFDPFVDASAKPHLFRDGVEYVVLKMENGIELMASVQELQTFTGILTEEEKDVDPRMVVRNLLDGAYEDGTISLAEYNMSLPLLDVLDEEREPQVVDTNTEEEDK